MVLEEASAQASSPDDDFPPTDRDPYGSSSSSAEDPTRFTIDLTNLPKPAPIIGPLTGYTENRLVRTIQAAQASAASLVGRPLTPEEAHAFAYAGAKGISIASWGIGLGGLTGVARAYQTATSFKFPLLRRGWPKLDRDAFGQLRGPQARRSWHLVRGCAYFGFGAFLGHLVFAAYAANVVAGIVANDPRIRDVAQVAMRRMEQKMKMARGQRQQQQQQQQRGGPGVEQGSRDWQAPLAQKTEVGASTIAGSPSMEQDSFQREDGPARVTGKSRIERDRAFRARDREMGKQRGAAQDNSPTAGNETQEVGSAWDRVRRGAEAEDGDVSTPNQSAWKAMTNSKTPDSRSTDDDFSFSKPDEERQLAKAEAQKEFDERVERERRGEDFADDRKKW